ncbi:MAG: hypothetical protein WCG27_06845 [Pseudomonadota bacterium]
MSTGVWKKILKFKYPLITTVVLITILFAYQNCVSIGDGKGKTDGGGGSAAPVTINPEYKYDGEYANEYIDAQTDDKYLLKMKLDKGYVVSSITIFPDGNTATGYYTQNVGTYTVKDGIYEFKYLSQTCNPVGQENSPITTGDSAQFIMLTDNVLGQSTKLYNKNNSVKYPHDIIIPGQNLVEDKQCGRLNNFETVVLTENSPTPTPTPTPTVSDGSSTPVSDSSSGTAFSYTTPSGNNPGTNGPVVGSTGFPVVDQVKSMIPCQSSQYGSNRINLFYKTAATPNSNTLSGQLQPGGIGGTPGNTYAGRNSSGDLLFAVQMNQGSTSIGYNVILSICPSPFFQSNTQYQQFSANGITVAANAGYQVGNLGSSSSLVVIPPNSTPRQIPLIFAPL